MNLVLLTSISIHIDIGLGCLIETFQKLLVDQVFTLLIIKANFILISIVFIVRVIASIFGLSLHIGKVGIILVTFFEVTLLLQIDNFGVIDTNRAFESLGTHNFVN